MAAAGWRRGLAGAGGRHVSITRRWLALRRSCPGRASLRTARSKLGAGGRRLLAIHPGLRRAVLRPRAGRSLPRVARAALRRDRAVCPGAGPAATGATANHRGEFGAGGFQPAPTARRPRTILPERWRGPVGATCGWQATSSLRTRTFWPRADARSAPDVWCCSCPASSSMTYGDSGLRCGAI